MDAGTMVTIASVVGSGLFSAGVFYGMTRSQIKRLEQKQDKHNGLIERMVKVEESTKSAHHRVDETDEQRERYWRDLSDKLDTIKDVITNHVKEYHTNKKVR